MKILHWLDDPLIEAWRLVRYGIVGVVAGIVFVGTCWLLSKNTGLGLVAVSVIGYLVAGVVSYFGHYHYSFSQEASHESSLPRFTAVVITNLIITVLVAWACSDAGLRLPRWMSILTIAALLPITNYISNRFWVFLPKPHDRIAEANKTVGTSR